MREREKVISRVYGRKFRLSSLRTIKFKVKRDEYNDAMYQKHKTCEINFYFKDKLFYYFRDKVIL